MGAHIVDGQFQSDKYRWCHPGFVPLKVTDLMAQPVLWEYARVRREVDAEFSDDLKLALVANGYCRPAEAAQVLAACETITKLPDYIDVPDDAGVLRVSPASYITAGQVRAIKAAVAWVDLPISTKAKGGETLTQAKQTTADVSAAESRSELGLVEWLRSVGHPRCHAAADHIAAQASEINRLEQSGQCA